MPRTRNATDAVLKELREFGLKYPGAHTKSPWPGHLDLAVNDKTFAYLSIEGQPFSISCKLPRSATAALEFPFAKPTGYGLGKSGWVSATFDKGQEPPVALLKSWIEESYRAQAPKKLAASLGDAAIVAKPKTKRKPTAKTGAKTTAMASQRDVRRIAMSLPGTVEEEDRFAFAVRNKGKDKGFAWVWLERIHPKKARVPNPAVLAVRVADLEEKDSAAVRRRAEVLHRAALQRLPGGSDPPVGGRHRRAGSAAHRRLALSGPAGAGRVNRRCAHPEPPCAAEAELSPRATNCPWDPQRVPNPPRWTAASKARLRPARQPCGVPGPAAR